MRFQKTTTGRVVVVLGASLLVQGCGEETSPSPHGETSSGASTGGGTAGNGGEGGLGGQGGLGGAAGNGGQGGSAGSGGQGGLGGAGGNGGQGGLGGAGGQGGIAGQGGMGGGPMDVCGNGMVANPEGCDDGNTLGGDGCAPNCTIEPGYLCSGSPSACTDVDECALNTDNCTANETCTNTLGSFTCSPADCVDPTNVSTGIAAIGPSEGLVALCNGQTLVGNQSLNRLEIRGPTGALVSTFGTPDKPFDIAYDAATGMAYATLFNNPNMVRVNLGTGVVTTIPLGGIGLRVAVGNNGLVFVTLSDSASFPNRPLVLVNGTTATVDKTLLLPYGGSLLAYDRNSDLLYLADAGASPSKLERYGFDPVAKTLTLQQSRANTGNNGLDLAISPDGLHVAFSCSQGNATNPLDYKLHDLSASDLNVALGIWNTGLYPTAAVFSPDNSKLMATNGSTFRRFEVATHSMIGFEDTLQPCVNGSVRRIAVSPGGTITYVITRCGSPPSSGILSRFVYP